VLGDLWLSPRYSAVEQEPNKKYKTNAGLAGVRMIFNQSGMVSQRQN
jgi:hypothetical protein